MLRPYKEGRRIQPDGSSRKTTYEELHTEPGTEPWGWLVTMILKSSGEAARSAMSVWRGSDGRGCAIARCLRIAKMISSAGARGVSTPALRNCNSELFSEKCQAERAQMVTARANRSLVAIGASLAWHFYENNS